MSSYNNFNKLINVVGQNAWANWQSLLNNPSKLSGSIVFVDTTNDNTANAVKCKLIYANGIVYNVADASAFNDLYTYVTNTVDGSIDDISSRLSQLSTYVKLVVDTSISNISTRLNEQSKNFVDLSTYVRTTVDTSISNISTRLSNTNTSLGNVSNNLADLSTYVRTSVDTSINNISTRLNEQSINLVDLSTYVRTTVDTSIGNISTRLSTTNATLDNVSSRLSTVTSGNDEVSTRLNDLSTYTRTAVNGSINDISSRLSTTNTNLGDVSTRLNDLSTYTRTTVNGSINDISSRLSTTNTNLNEVSTRLNNTSTALNDLSTYVRTIVDSSINDLSSGLNAIKNSIGLKDNYDLDLTLDASTSDLKDDVTIKEAILTLEKMLLEQKASLTISDSSLNQLINDYRYVAPDPINATIVVTPSSIFNGQSVNATWTVTLNNYQSNIATATLDGQDIATTLRTGTASIQSQVSVPTTKSVTISSNYTDSHGTSPAIYNGSASIIVTNKHYVTTNATKYNNVSQFPIANTNLLTYTTVIDDNVYDAVCSAEFIYVLSTKNVPSTNTKIHNTGTSAIGTGGVLNLGAVSITEFDSPVTYYLYKSELKLTGNWTIEL